VPTAAPDRADQARAPASRLGGSKQASERGLAGPEVGSHDSEVAGPKAQGTCARPTVLASFGGLPQSSVKVAAPITPEPKPLGEALVFMQVLWAVAHGLESASKRMHAELGVTGPQRLVLRIIGHHGRISAGELAEVMHIHPSSLTGMLQRLEQAELIRRESDPFDRRRALLELTRRGMRLNNQRQGTIEVIVEDTLQRMPRERVATTKAVLSTIAAALGGTSETEGKAGSAVALAKKSRAAKKPRK
jgi:DNA-binding MarR family transcriptional regulator